VRVTEVKRGFARAELVELLTPSALRRAAPCPIANECGGCDWTALRLDAQLAAKERILRESMRRIGKFDPETLPPIAIHPSPLNYRIRSRLHRDGDAVGFYATQSHEVVPLARECEVVGLRTREAPREGESWEIDGRVVIDGTMLIEGFHVTTDSFFQVNRHLLGTMQRLVTEIASRATKRRTAVDLYSGVGFFTRPLSALFAEVTAVEGSPASHNCAKRNASANVKLINAPVEGWIEHMPQTDFVFLDPPRAGARRNVIERIARRTSAMICFLACDPVTFSRDASRLIASGWSLASLDLLDLFPNTHHVETLASFERAHR
jgi:tRNA/tmRNA/rRNA uracil-C5-methylase (TrmA/RlmC/RlmD family)